MIALSPEAEAQLDALVAYYEALGRVEASINLLNALVRRTRLWTPRLRRKAGAEFRGALMALPADRGRYRARDEPRGMV
jgi:hypothetical protein